MNHEDCKELFEAGQTLLEKSGLANFSNRRFVARNDEQIIERDWAAQFDPRFGRYMAWVLFVVGAENLAKAPCVCSNVINVSSKPKSTERIWPPRGGRCSGTRVKDDN